MVVRKILETTLTAGQTSVHFTDGDIPLSLIRVYTSDPDLLPIERTLSGNTVTVYFEEQSSNVGVALEIVKAGLDIIDDLTSTDATAALSAKQGKVLKGLIDDIVVPTVNDGTLTIQKNGTDVQTFTANSATDKTANITVPTALSELSDDSTHRLVTDTQVSNWNNVSSKTDISAIGTNETGTTASKAYSVGEHFYKDGKFCTAKTAIASGATFTLNTNYEESTIAEEFNKVSSSTATAVSGVTTVSSSLVLKFGRVVIFKCSFTLLNNITSNNTTTILKTPFSAYSSLLPVVTFNTSSPPYKNLDTIGWIDGTDVRLRDNLNAGSYQAYCVYICQ